MTIREAAEVLYDEYTGTKGLLSNSTQEARWIAFTEKVIAVAGVEGSPWSESQIRADERGRISDLLRNMVTTDDGKTVAQFVHVANWLDGLD